MSVCLSFQNADTQIESGLGYQMGANGSTAGLSLGRESTGFRTRVEKTVPRLLDGSECAAAAAAVAHQRLHGTTSELPESIDEFQIMDALTAVPRADGKGEPFDFLKTTPRSADHHLACVHL